MKFTEIVQTFKLLKDYITLSGVFCSGNAEKNKSIKSYIGSIAGSSIIKMEDLKLYKIEKKIYKCGCRGVSQSLCKPSKLSLEVFIIARRKSDSPQKEAMSEMMQGYLKDNDISIKSGNDVNHAGHDVCFNGRGS